MQHWQLAWACHRRQAVLSVADWLLQQLFIKLPPAALLQILGLHMAAVIAATEVSGGTLLPGPARPC